MWRMPVFKSMFTLLYVCHRRVHVVVPDAGRWHLLRRDLARLPNGIPLAVAKADLQCYHLCDATGSAVKPAESWDRVARRRLGGLKQRVQKRLGGKTTGDEEEAKEPHQ